MAKIERHIGDNIGGFHTLYLAKVKDLTSNNFDAQKFQNIYLTPQTGKWERKMKESKNDVYCEHNLIFQVPKFRKEVEDYISETNEVALIAYIVLVNGDFVRIGSLTSPLFLTADFESGKNFADSNSYGFGGTATEAVNMKKNSAIIISSPPKPPLKTSDGLRLRASNSNYVQTSFSYPIAVNDSYTFSFVIKIKSLDFADRVLINQHSATNFNGLDLRINPLSVGYNLSILHVGSGNLSYINSQQLSFDEKYIITISRTNYTDIGTKIFVNATVHTTSGYSTLNGTENTLNTQNWQLGAWADLQNFTDMEFYDFKFFNTNLNDTDCLYLQNNNNQIDESHSYLRENLLLSYVFEDSEGILLNEEVSGYYGILQNYPTPTVTRGSNNSWIDTNAIPV
jgi:hypothetical protein